MVDMKTANAARWASEIPPCMSRWGAYECTQSEGHGGYHETDGGLTRWNDGAAAQPTQKKSATRHPSPSEMARERYGNDNLSHMSMQRSAFADGVAAERARYAAVLRAEACPMRADDLEGKVSS